jgi:hypothetical protein
VFVVVVCFRVVVVSRFRLTFALMGQSPRPPGGGKLRGGERLLLLL